MNRMHEDLQTSASARKLSSAPEKTIIQRLRALGLHGVADDLDGIEDASFIPRLLEIEESARKRRSLERRLTNARIGRFKSMADFDWNWPKKVDRVLIEDLLKLHFLAEAENVVILGPNGVGKTMIAQNIAHQAVMAGHKVRMVSASELLCDLAAQDATSALLRRLRRYTRPDLLVIDELGYLSGNAHHGDLFFEVISRRYQERRPIVLTTNKPFFEWGQIFPSAGCVVTMVDRLIHRCEILSIDGESYRLKESRAQSEARKKSRQTRTEDPL